MAEKSLQHTFIRITTAKLKYITRDDMPHTIRLPAVVRMTFNKQNTREPNAMTIGITGAELNARARTSACNSTKSKSINKIHHLKFFLRGCMNSAELEPMVPGLVQGTHINAGFRKNICFMSLESAGTRL